MKHLGIAGLYTNKILSMFSFDLCFEFSRQDKKIKIIEIINGPVTFE